MCRRHRFSQPRRAGERLGSLALLALLSLATGCAVFEGWTSEQAPESNHSAHALVADNGLVSNGLGANGISFNGLTLNGIYFNGVYFNSVGLNGIYFNSLTHNGIYFNSVELNGIYFNGIYFNGLTYNGIYFNGVEHNGIYFNGIYFNGIYFNGVYFNGVELSSEQQVAFRQLFETLVACALPEGESVTVTDFGGTEVTFPGSAGIDPGWATSAPDLTKSGLMAECVIERGTAAGHTVAHEPVNIAAFKKILQYAVECALPAPATECNDPSDADSDPGCIAYVDETGADQYITGALGLAPEWKSDGLSDVGQRRVSACLAARTNARGQTVQISLRARDVAVSAVERAQYVHHEGGFWGNLFSTDAAIHTCAVLGAGPSGRLCTQEDGCGFTYEGSCSSACQSRDDSNGYYYDCAGESEVVGTFLPLSDDVAFGFGHSCLKRADRSVWCWGANDVGQLGNGIATGTAEITLVPERVQELGANASQLVAGQNATCVRDRNGGVSCWGGNQWGQIGDGTTTTRPLPVAITALDDDVAQMAGRFHTCAVKTDGTAWCWGKNDRGQVGTGAAGQDVLYPAQVVDLVGVAKIVTAEAHTCALTNDGTVWCWGGNQGGQVGDGSTTDRYQPTAVLAGAIDLHTRNFHTCAIKADGTTWCWGSNSLGQLGDGAYPFSSSTVPVRVVGLPATDTPQAVQTGMQHSCVLMRSGSVWCWGDNEFGQLGDGSTIRATSVAAPVPGIAAGVRLAAGYLHGCVTKRDGTLWCWGDNHFGQLGDGTTDQADVPVPMTNSPCGDGVCDSAIGETPEACAADCCQSDEVTDCDLCGGQLVTDGNLCGWSWKLVTDCKLCGRDRGVCNTCPVEMANTCADPSACRTCSVASCELFGSSGPVCGDAVVDPGEECDGGPCCNADCTLASPGTECRDSTDPSCDPAETCDGTSAECPADVNTCSAPPACEPGTCPGDPSCSPAGETCSSDADCCDGLACRGGKSKTCR